MRFFDALFAGQDEPLSFSQSLTATLILVAAAAATLLPGLNAPLPQDALPAVTAAWQLPAAGPYQPLAALLLQFGGAVFHHQLWGFRLLAFLGHALAATLVWRTGRQLRLPGAWLAGLLVAIHPLATLPFWWPAKSAAAWALAAMLGTLLCYRQHLRAEDRIRFPYVAAVILFLAATLLHPAAAALLPVLWMLGWAPAPRSTPGRSTRSRRHSESASSSRTPTAKPVAIAAQPAAPPPAPQPIPAAMSLPEPRRPTAAPPQADGARHHHHHGHPSRHRREDDRSWWRRLLHWRPAKAPTPAMSRIPLPNLDFNKIRQPALRDLVRLSPFLLLALTTLAVNLLQHLRVLRLTPSFQLAPPGISGLAATGWGLMLSLFQALVPLPGMILRNPWAPSPAGVTAWLCLGLPLAVAVAAGFYRNRWGRLWLPLLTGQLLLAMVFIILLAPVSLTERLGVFSGAYLLLPGWSLALTAAAGTLLAGLPPSGRRAAALTLSVLALAGIGSATLASRTVLGSADRFWEKLAQFSPDSPVVQTRLAKRLAATGEYTKAQAGFEKVLASHPDHVPALEGLAQCLQVEGNSYLAVAKLEKAVSLDAENPWLRFRLATALMDWNMDARAADELRQAAILKGDFPEATLLMAAAIARNQRTSEAGAILEKQLQQHPTYAPAQALLGFLMSGRSDDQAANRCFEQAAKLDPDRPLFRLCRAWHRYVRNQNGQARADLEVVLQHTPGSPLANLLMAAATADAGQAEAAHRHLESAITAAPRDPAVLTMAAAIYGTHPLTAVRNPSRAVELAKAACSISENRSLDSLIVLAFAYANAGDPLHAERTVQRALPLSNDSRQRRQTDLLQVFLGALNEPSGAQLKAFLRTQIQVTDFADALKVIPNEVKTLEQPHLP